MGKMNVTVETHGLALVLVFYKKELTSCFHFVFFPQLSWNSEILQVSIVSKNENDSVSS